MSDRALATEALDTLFAAETPEGITLAQRPAGMVSRILAFLVDFAVRAIAMIAASMVSSPLRGVGTALLFILWFLAEWFYPVVFELAPGSATPGKRMLNLKVVMDSGLPVTPAASLIRNLLRTIDFLPLAYGFGLAAMLMRADFKRIGDLAAGTLVVHVERIALHGKLPAAAARAPARPLRLREQAAVIAWAARSTRLTQARTDELALLALPLLPALHTAQPDPHLASAQLLGVAHWVLGERGADAKAPHES